MTLVIVSVLYNFILVFVSARSAVLSLTSLLSGKNVVDQSIDVDWTCVCFDFFGSTLRITPRSLFSGSQLSSKN